MSERRARGSRQPATRPNFCFHASVPGTSDPTSFLFQRGQPTSAALDRSREAGTTRPLMCRRSVSVWKWNWVFTHARRPLGTYSSQISGGSTIWLSQSKMEKSLLVMAVPPRHRCDSRAPAHPVAGAAVDAEAGVQAGGVEPHSAHPRALGKAGSAGVARLPLDGRFTGVVSDRCGTHRYAPSPVSADGRPAPDRAGLAGSCAGRGRAGDEGVAAAG